MTKCGVYVAMTLFSVLIFAGVATIISQNNHRENQLHKIMKDIEKIEKVEKVEKNNSSPVNPAPPAARFYKSPPQKQSRLHSSQNSSALSAPMPTEQLMASEYFPNTVNPQMTSLNSGQGVGLATNPIVAEGKSSTSSSLFTGGLYTQDPSMMTPSTGMDSLGIEAYMPSEKGATKDGLDPNTGLPVFSTQKLLRSNQLSSRGMHGFLRQVQDPYTGYKKLGRRMFTCSQQYEADVNRRREQFNKARMSGQDPVLFNTSGWAYF